MVQKVEQKLIPMKDLSEKDVVLRKAKWAAMKEEFIELSITNKGVHWPSLAGKYGFLPTTARNRASTHKWYAEIELRAKERENILEDKLRERTTMALDELNKDFATNEASIRKRHASMARGLQARAVARLKEIPLSDFTARDALAMLKLGIDEERFAMGMPQVYAGAKEVNSHDEFKPIVEQIGGHQKVQRIGMLLLEALKSAPTEAQLLADSGLGPTDVTPMYQPVPEGEKIVYGVDDEDDEPDTAPAPKITIKKATP